MIPSSFNNKHLINCRGRLIDLSQPLVMGIVNVTPDSFYGNSRTQKEEHIRQRAAQVINQGGKIIDVGGYSSRPGADHISEKQEWDRLASALSIIRKDYPEIIISIDTFRSSIAKKAVIEFEADMINDISAGALDEKMFETIAELQVPYILMHMKGNPQNMKEMANYQHLMREVFLYFAEKTARLKSMGVNDMIIDPGFGFAKKLDHNYQLLSRLDEFKVFELPLLIGVSRKSMIYRYLGTSANEALNGTTALNTIAITKGANILRVHDVKEAYEVIQLHKKLKMHQKI